MKLQASAVKQLALAHGLAVAQPRSLRLDGKFPDDAQAARAALLGRAAGRAGGGRLWPDPAAVGAGRCRAWAASTSMVRCCRAGAVRRRCSAPSKPAMRKPASRIMQMDAGLDTGDMLRMRGHCPSSRTTPAPACRSAWRNWARGCCVETLRELAARPVCAPAAARRGRELRRTRSTRPRPPIDWRQARLRSSAACAPSTPSPAPASRCTARA